MSKVLSVNYTDTPIPNVEELVLERGRVNYAADFRVTRDTPSTGGAEVKITNLTSPIPFPEDFRFSVSNVNNIYAGTAIDPSFWGPTRSGVSILCQLTESWSVTDTEDPTYLVGLPVSAHLVIKVPRSEQVTPALVEGLVGRLVSGLYETGDEGTNRLSSMLRGSLKPSDL